MEASSKKRADPGRLAAAEQLLAAVVSQITGSAASVDVAAVSRDCEALAALTASDFGLTFESRSGMLTGDWKLVWVSADDAIGTLGTGLHRVPLTRLQDIYVSFKGGVGRSPPRVEVAEILRILGPFPNVRNTLAGAVQASGAELALNYDTMIDGNGGLIKAPDGSGSRVVRFVGGFVGPTALVLSAAAGPGEAPFALALVKEPNVEAVFRELRVDRPENWDQPQAKPAFKFPWQ
jgi:hypothetical protein